MTILLACEWARDRGLAITNRRSPNFVVERPSKRQSFIIDQPLGGNRSNWFNLFLQRRLILQHGRGIFFFEAHSTIQILIANLVTLSTFSVVVKPVKNCPQ